MILIYEVRELFQNRWEKGQWGGLGVCVSLYVNAHTHLLRKLFYEKGKLSLRKISKTGMHPPSHTGPDLLIIIALSLHLSKQVFFPFWFYSDLAKAGQCSRVIDVPAPGAPPVWLLLPSQGQLLHQSQAGLFVCISGEGGRWGTSGGLREGERLKRKKRRQTLYAWDDFILKIYRYMLWT